MSKIGKAGQKARVLGKRAARFAGRVFRKKKKTVLITHFSGLRQKFPELHSFLARETSFFPALAKFTKMAAFEIPMHPTGEPIITGDKKLDRRLLVHCMEISVLSKQISQNLLAANLHPEKIAHEIEIARMREELLCDEKTKARQIIITGLKSIEAGKGPQVSSYTPYRQMNAIDALRMFLAQEAGFFPKFYKLRERLAAANPKNKNAENVAFHEGTRTPKITGSESRDKELAVQCIKIFTNRKFIRDKMRNARLAKSEGEMLAELQKASELEKQIDFFKANVRTALLAAFAKRK